MSFFFLTEDTNAYWIHCSRILFKKWEITCPGISLWLFWIHRKWVIEIMWLFLQQLWAVLAFHPLFLICRTALDQARCFIPAVGSQCQAGGADIIGQMIDSSVGSFRRLVDNSGGSSLLPPSCRKLFNSNVVKGKDDVFRFTDMNATDVPPNTTVSGNYLKFSLSRDGRAICQKRLWN